MAMTINIKPPFFARKNLAAPAFSHGIVRGAFFVMKAPRCLTEPPDRKSVSPLLQNASNAVSPASGKDAQKVLQ